MRKSLNEILDETLTPQHRVDGTILGFIKEYVICKHVAEAAKACKLKINEANTIMNMPDVYDCIKMIIDEHLAFGKSYDLNQVFARMSEIVNADYADFLNPDGSYKCLHELPASLTRAIKKVKTVKEIKKDPNGIDTGEFAYRITSLELQDKVRPMELLGRNEGAFREVIEHTHEISKRSAEILLGSAEARAEARMREAREIRSIPIIEVKVDNDGK